MENDDQPAATTPEAEGPASGGSQAATKPGGEFIESWAHPNPDKAPPEPPRTRRVPRVVWRVVAVVVFLAFAGFAFLGPLHGGWLCSHPGSGAALPLRILVALVGFAIARGIWILGGTEPEPWRYVGPNGVPQPVKRQGRRRTGAWWALFPWFFFLAFVASIFIFPLGDCG